MGACISPPGVVMGLETDNSTTSSQAVENMGENRSSEKTEEKGDLCVTKPTNTFSNEADTNNGNKDIKSELFVGVGRLPLFSYDSFKETSLFSSDVFADLASGSESKDECEWRTDESSESWNDGFFSFDGLNKRTSNRYAIGLEMLKAKIHHGANPKNLVTHGNRSCLMFSVLAEDFAFVKKLVELGVDVNETNRQGETALGFANKLQSDDIANYLRRKGALEAVDLVTTRGVAI